MKQKGIGLRQTNNQTVAQKLVSFMVVGVNINKIKMIFDLKFDMHQAIKKPHKNMETKESVN